MVAVMFDTYAVIKRLQESGFSEQQAETMAGVLQDTQKTSSEHLATKWDIQDLQRDIKELEANTKRDLKELETNLRQDMREMEMTLHKEIDMVRKDIDMMRKDIDVKLAELRTDLLKWTVGILLAQAAVIATLVKLL